MLINVLDYATPALAIAAAIDGDRIYFPNIAPYAAPPGGWLIRRNIEIFGDGPGSVGTADGTTFYPGGDADTDHVFVLSPEIGVELSHLYFHDFKITKRPGQSGRDGSAGFYCKTTIGQKKSASRYERIAVLNLRKTAFHFEGLNGGDEAIVSLSFMDCDATLCGRGMYFKNVYTCAHIRSYCNTNDDEGCYAEDSGIAYFHSGFENNCIAGGTANLYLNRCYIATVVACHFERIGNGPKCGVRMDHCGGAGSVSGCTFVDVADVGSTAIYVPSDNDAGPVVILSNRANNIPVIANVGSQAYDCVIMPQYSVTTPANIGAQMQLPADRGTLGAPLVSRGGIGPTGSNTPSGLSVPAVVGGASQLQYVIDGMLFYDKDSLELRLRRNGVWAPATQIVDANVPTNADINGSKLANASVGTAKLVDSSVTGIKIEAGAVSSTRLADSAVIESKIATAAVTINKVAAGAITRSRLLLNTVIATFAAGAAVIPAHGYRAYNLSLGTPATGVTVGPTIDDVNLHEALTIEVRVAGDGVPTGDWPLLMPKIYADASGANGLFWLILVNPKGTDVSPNGLEIRIEFLRRV